MDKKLKNYINKCGGCVYYQPYVINGKLVRRGKCNIASTDYFMHRIRGIENPYRARHSKYRSASNQKCKKYCERKNVKTEYIEI